MKTFIVNVYAVNVFIAELTGTATLEKFNKFTYTHEGIEYTFYETIGKEYRRKVENENWSWTENGIFYDKSGNLNPNKKNSYYLTLKVDENNQFIHHVHDYNDREHFFEVFNYAGKFRKKEIEYVMAGLEKLKTILSDVDGYIEKQKEHFALKELERTEQRKKYDEVLEQRRIKEEEEEKAKIEKSRINFKEGKEIDPSYFIILCKEVGINIPIQTMGYVNKNVRSIGFGGWRIASGTRSKKLGSIVLQLKRKLLQEV